VTNEQGGFIQRPLCHNPLAKKAERGHYGHWEFLPRFQSAVLDGKIALSVCKASATSGNGPQQGQEAPKFSVPHLPGFATKAAVICQFSKRNWQIDS